MVVWVDVSPFPFGGIFRFKMLVDSGEYIISSIFGKGRGPSFWLTLLSGDKKSPLSSTPQDLAPQLCAMLMPRLSQDHLMPGRIERNLLKKVQHPSFIIDHH